MIDPSITTMKYLADVKRVLTVKGTSVPPEFEAVRDGLEHLAALRTSWPHEARQGLDTAVTTGDPAKVRAAVREVVIAKAWAASAAVSESYGAALRALRAAYATAAAANYRAVRGELNTAIDALRKDSQAVDLNAPAESVVSASAKVRTAWELGRADAERVESLAELLLIASQLAGVTLSHPSHEASTDQVLALVAETPTDGEPMRNLWSVFDAGASHRAGTFAALADAGLLTHAPDLADLSALRRPRGWDTRYVASAHGFRPLKVDLETGISYGADGTPHVEESEARVTVSY